MINALAFKADDPLISLTVEGEHDVILLCVRMINIVSGYQDHYISTYN